MGNTSPLSSSPTPNLKESYTLPRKYKILKVLGKGGFGVVLKCWDRNTKQIVAIKLAKDLRDLSNEAAILKVLMDNHLDQWNIVKFYKGFWMNQCLVFEALDISLSMYLKRKDPMRLQDIRTVIQQLATAFDALKTIGVIHGDVKTSNIMLVDHVRQPFKVKLIDFGLAIFKSEANHVIVNQTPFFRAPEIMLGLPFSEAIDMWSLGCVMAIMMFGTPLFPGRTDHELLQYITELLGPPPDHFIKTGRKWRMYFQKTDTKQWVLKDSCGTTTTDKRCYTFRSLDEMKTMRLEKDNPTEADERRECIELLKAMLKWDERERITPSKILAHPFISMSCVCSSSHLSSCYYTSDSTGAETSSSKAANPSTCQTEPDPDQAAQSSTDQDADPGTRQAQTRTKETIMRTHTDDMATSRVQPSGLIMIQPAPPQNRIPLEERSDDLMSLSLERSGESDTFAFTSEDSSFAAAPASLLCNDNNDLHHTDDSEPKKKKGTNHFKHFSCMKRTFCSCNVDNMQK